MLRGRPERFVKPHLVQRRYSSIQKCYTTNRKIINFVDYLAQKRNFGALLVTSNAKSARIK